MTSGEEALEHTDATSPAEGGPLGGAEDRLESPQEAVEAPLAETEPAADRGIPPATPEAAAPAATEPAENEKKWYVLKVQSNREDSIAEAIKRRLKLAGIDEFVAEVIVPTEKVLEIKDGKKKVVKRKFYPGYIMLRMEMNDDVWFTIRDTPGVGHFVGSGDKPSPMNDRDVAKMLDRVAKPVDEAGKPAPEPAPRPQIDFAKGDRVVIKEGPFENFEGDVDDVHEDKGMVRVMIQIFGRPTPVDVEYWQVGKIRT